MNSIVIGQTVVVSILVALLCLALLLGILLMPGSISGAHHWLTGIMLIDPPYRIG